MTSLEVGVVELGALESVELLLLGRIGDALEQLGGIDVHTLAGLVAVDQVVREDIDFHFLGLFDLNLERHLVRTSLTAGRMRANSARTR